MTKGEFRDLLLRALNAAADAAETRLERTIPRNFEIELYGPGSAGQLLSVDQALEYLYLGDDRFYRVIDVAIRKLLPGKSIVFVRVSGHNSASFKETWRPAQFGPFKEIDAVTIECAVLKMRGAIMVKSKKQIQAEEILPANLRDEFENFIEDYRVACAEAGIRPVLNYTTFAYMIRQGWRKTEIDSS